MPYVNSDGWDIWYEVAGSGPPLVLCGGPIMMHDQFGPAMPALNREFQTINWNWRGGGNSERTWMNGIRFDDWVNDMMRVMDRLKLEKTDFWGISSGALFPIRFAAKYPERVRKMVLYPSFQGAAAKDVEFMAELVRRQGTEGQIWSGFWSVTSEEAFNSGKVVQLALDEIEIAKRNMPASIVTRVNAVYTDIDLSADVAKLKMPVLLLIGGSGRNGASAPNVSAIIKRFQTLCPQAELAAIPGAGGTLAAIEQPDASVAAVRKFLKG